MSIARQFKPPAKAPPYIPPAIEVAKEKAETRDKLKPKAAGRPKSADPKEVVTLRLPRSEIARWKAKGENWRSLMEERLRG